MKINQISHHLLVCFSVPMLTTAFWRPRPILFWIQSKVLCEFCIKCFHVTEKAILLMCVCVLSRVWLFVISWTAGCLASLSTEFSRQEYWSGLPLLSPGDLPNPGIEPASLAPPALAGGFFTTAPPGKPLHLSWLLTKWAHFRDLLC